ncbi:Tyrosinase-like protein 4 [Elsinoe fawcettii]|nr:Tyrosinase-like protein 4 [Elsinoe fawcettii]
MQLLYLLAGGTLAAALPSSSNSRAAWVPDSTDGTDRLYKQGLAKLALSGIADIKSNGLGVCNLATAKKRREWHTLSSSDKKAYLNAVKCLMKKPSRMTATAPGAKSRYDDFVAVHIQNTLSIHGTGNFLSWHRYFLQAYESALRDECGYKDAHPYLNWGKLASAPLKSPLFDGSDTSIGGDGKFKEHAGAQIPSPALPFITLPPGTGGDCITTGPFKDMEVRLGPLAPYLNYVSSNPSPDGLGYNPRCLRRDINSPTAAKNLHDDNSTALITNSPDVLTFQNSLQGDFASGLLGVHTAGHFLVGGDPGGDLFASPGDPYFFLHHGQIDRTWWIWQNQDLASRERALAGTLTLFNNPPSRDTALTDEIDLGTLAKKVVIGDVMSTTKGALCYIYV